MPIATPLRNRVGFSLIEILIVISIIALLVALLVPVIGMVRASARTVGCMNNLSQIGVAMRSWASDHDGVIVPAWDDTLGAGSIQSYWQGQLYVFMFGGDVRTNGKLEQTFRCPEMRGERNWAANDPTTYGKNIYTGQAPPPQWDNGYRLVKYARIPVPSEAMMITDTAAYATGPSTGRHPRDIHAWIDQSETCGIWGVEFSHRGRAPFLMADGHVDMRTREWAETWRINWPDFYRNSTFWNVLTAP